MPSLAETDQKHSPTAGAMSRKRAVEEHMAEFDQRQSRAGIEPLLNGREVAELFGAPLTTIYEHARSGLLPCVRIGRAVRFRPADLRAFIDGGGQSLEHGWRREAP